MQVGIYLINNRDPWLIPKVRWKVIVLSVSQEQVGYELDNRLSPLAQNIKRQVSVGRSECWI